MRFFHAASADSRTRARARASVLWEPYKSSDAPVYRAAERVAPSYPARAGGDFRSSSSGGDWQPPREPSPELRGAVRPLRPARSASPPPQRDLPHRSFRSTSPPREALPPPPQRGFRDALPPPPRDSRDALARDRMDAPRDMPPRDIDSRGGPAAAGAPGQRPVPRFFDWGVRIKAQKAAGAPFAASAPSQQPPPPPPPQAPPQAPSQAPPQARQWGSRPVRVSTGSDFDMQVPPPPPPQLGRAHSWAGSSSSSDLRLPPPPPPQPVLPASSSSSAASSSSASAARPVDWSSRPPVPPPQQQQQQRTSRLTPYERYLPNRPLPVSALPSKQPRLASDGVSPPRPHSSGSGGLDAPPVRPLLTAADRARVPTWLTTAMASSQTASDSQPQPAASRAPTSTAAATSMGALPRPRPSMMLSSLPPDVGATKKPMLMKTSAAPAPARTSRDDEDDDDGDDDGWGRGLTALSKPKSPSPPPQSHSAASTGDDQAPAPPSPSKDDKGEKEDDGKDDDRPREEAEEKKKKAAKPRRKPTSSLLAGLDDALATSADSGRAAKKRAAELISTKPPAAAGKPSATGPKSALQRQSSTTSSAAASAATGASGAAGERPAKKERVESRPPSPQMDERLVELRACAAIAQERADAMERTLAAAGPRLPPRTRRRQATTTMVQRIVACNAALAATAQRIVDERLGLPLAVAPVEPPHVLPADVRAAYQPPPEAPPPPAMPTLTSLLGAFSYSSSRYPRRGEIDADFEARQRYMMENDRREKERKRNAAVPPEVEKQAAVVAALGRARFLTTDGRPALCRGKSGACCDAGQRLPALTVPSPLACNCSRALPASATWSDVELCVFVDKMLQYPKDFARIASFLVRKTPADVVELYYDVKKKADFKAALQEQVRSRKELQGGVNPLIARDVLARLGVRPPEQWPLNASWAPVPAAPPLIVVPAVVPAQPLASLVLCAPCTLDSAVIPELVGADAMAAYAKEHLV